MMIRSLCLITCVLASQAMAQQSRPVAKPTNHKTSEDRFEVCNVEGWTVYINRDVPREYPEQTARTLEHLKWELYQIKLAAPALAVTNMQENNAIWIEYNEKVSLSYHPSRDWLIDHGYTIPRDFPSFMSLSVKTHFGDSYRHPFVVFHELAHGYDYHFIGKGRDYGNAESQANYERMMKEGKYEKVLIWNGRIGSHYGRTNRMEYWAESTEAYFAVAELAIVANPAPAEYHMKPSASPPAIGKSIIPLGSHQFTGSPPWRAIDLAWRCGWVGSSVRNTSPRKGRPMAWAIAELSSVS